MQTEPSAHAAQGLCPKCLLDAGFESQTAAPTAPFITAITRKYASVTSTGAPKEAQATEAEKRSYSANAMHLAASTARHGVIDFQELISGIKTPHCRKIGALRHWWAAGSRAARAAKFDSCSPGATCVASRRRRGGGQRKTVEVPAPMEPKTGAAVVALPLHAHLVGSVFLRPTHWRAV